MLRIYGKIAAKKEKVIDPSSLGNLRAEQTLVLLLEPIKYNNQLSLPTGTPSHRDPAPKLWIWVSLPAHVLTCPWICGGRRLGWTWSLCARGECSWDEMRDR